MARPTKVTIALAGRLGRPAATVQGWLDRGYGPAQPLTPRRECEHFDAVAEYAGPGHDPTVACLKLAAAGYPTANLRAVLRGLVKLDPGEEDTQDPEELVEGAMSNRQLMPITAEMRRRAHLLGPLPEHEALASDIDEPGTPELLLRSAMLPVADAVTGQEVEPLDLIDLGHVIDAGTVRAGVLTLDPEASGQIDLAILRRTAKITRGAEAWLETAGPAELARGVQAAKVLVEALALLGIRFSDLGDEDRWRTVGRLAPVAVPMLHSLLAVSDVVLPLIPTNELSEMERAYIRAIGKGRQVVEHRET
jgi:hypothetical protein